MSKQSTVTVRDQPVADMTSVSGALKIHAEDDHHRHPGAFRDLRSHRAGDGARRPARRSSEGIVNVFSMHTTCSVFINEIPDGAARRHPHVSRSGRRSARRHGGTTIRRYSDCDRENADSHLRAMLLGHSLSLQVSGGEVVLGQWQRILMAELDGPRSRTLRRDGHGHRVVRPCYAARRSIVVRHRRQARAPASA